MQADYIEVVRLRQTLQGIFMRDQRGAGAVDVGVVVGMIPVPVRIDRPFQRSLAEIVERRLETVPGHLRKRIDQQLAILAVQDHHVSARALKQSQTVREFRGCERHFAEPRASRGETLVWRAILLRHERTAGGKSLREDVCQRPSTRQASGGSQKLPPSRSPDVVAQIHEAPRRVELVSRRGEYNKFAME